MDRTARQTGSGPGKELDALRVRRSTEDLLQWAEQIGPETLKAAHLQQRAGALACFCTTLQRDVETYGATAVEEACRVLQHNGGLPKLKLIRLYLKEQLHGELADYGTPLRYCTGITRGVDQYAVDPADDLCNPGKGEQSDD